MGPREHYLRILQIYLQILRLRLHLQNTGPTQNDNGNQLNGVG